MSNLSAKLDGKLAQAVSLGKAAARHEGDRRLRRIRFADDVLDRVLSHLGTDAISAGELRDAKRRLRFEANWYYGDPEEAI